MQLFLCAASSRESPLTGIEEHGQIEPLYSEGSALSDAENFFESQAEKRVTLEKLSIRSCIVRLCFEAEAGGGLL